MTAAKGGPFGGRFLCLKQANNSPAARGTARLTAFRPGVPARRPPFPRFLSGAFYFSHAKNALRRERFPLK